MKGLAGILLFEVIDVNKHKEQAVLFIKGRQADILLIWDY
jgi:hypothetical protein